MSNRVFPTTTGVPDRRLLVTYLICTVVVLSGLGCRGTTRTFEDLKLNLTKSADRSTDPAPTNEQVDLLLPKKIDVLPFTKPASFDQDHLPDGIEVVLRPLDAFGDQTKAIGQFRFELYRRRKATADPRGHRLGIWDVDLTAEQAQAKHWDRITRTYRFRLLWTGASIEPGRYVLDVTYISPWDSRLTSTYMLEAKIPRAKIKQQIEERRNRDAFKLF